MEIKINFEKIHFWILFAAIVLIGGWIFVYAAGTQGHLWSDITNKPSGFADDVDNTGGILTCTRRAGTATTTDCSTANCDTGEYLTGGGCITGSGTNNVVGWPYSSVLLSGSYICGDQGTQCGDHGSPIIAYAICCKIT